MKHKKNFLFLFLFLSAHSLIHGMLHKDLLQKKLIEATKEDDGNAVFQLLLNGADPNKLFEDTTATKIAICDGKINALNQLLAANGNPEAAATTDHSALFMSIKRGNAEVLELLLSYKIGNDPDRQKILQQIITINNSSIASLLQKYNYISGEDITLSILNITKNPRIEEVFLKMKKSHEQDLLKKTILKKNNYKAKRKHSEEEIQEEKCAICGDEFTEESKNTENYFNCSHYNQFHGSCIKQWKSSCPICRSKKPKIESSNQPLLNSSIHHDYDYASTL
ncbi:ankyrin repeat domain-containing protein [Candidatus Babeliales bacterium]|nr:ankyrin repeat domain-containing protein [Candidatus Babeliales bacterium]